MVITGIFPGGRNNCLPGVITLLAQPIDNMAFRGCRTTVFRVGIASIFFPVVTFVGYTEIAISSPYRFALVISGLKQDAAFAAGKAGRNADILHFAVANTCHSIVKINHHTFHFRPRDDIHNATDSIGTVYR